MMKGRKGGYVLVYVLIVIVIVSTLGLAVCSASLRNLQIQAAAVHQMQDKYTAEGEIERFCAWLLKLEVDTSAGAVPFESTVKNYNTSATANVNVDVDMANNAVMVTAESNSVKVTAKLEVVVADNKVIHINYESYTIGTSAA